jgi:hypothetical protein
MIAIAARTGRILRSHARHIQQIGRRAVRDIVEIGRRLCDAKRRLGHGKFLCWIAAEFGWSERTAENFMRIYDLSKSEKFANLDVVQLPISALYLLAAPSTPDQAIEQVAMRAGNSNGLSLADVKDIIANSRRSSVLVCSNGSLGRPHPVANSSGDPSDAAPCPPVGHRLAKRRCYGGRTDSAQLGD